MSQSNLTEKILELLTSIKDDVVELKITSAKQEVNMVQHMKRTGMLEEEQKLQRERFIPLEDHVKFQKTLLNLLIGLASITGLFTFLWQIYKH